MIDHASRKHLVPMLGDGRSTALPIGRVCRARHEADDPLVGDPLARLVAPGPALGAARPVPEAPDDALARRETSLLAARLASASSGMIEPPSTQWPACRQIEPCGRSGRSGRRHAPMPRSCMPPRRRAAPSRGLPGLCGGEDRLEPPAPSACMRASWPAQASATAPILGPRRSPAGRQWSSPARRPASRCPVFMR